MGHTFKRKLNLQLIKHKLLPLPRIRRNLPLERLHLANIHTNRPLPAFQPHQLTLKPLLNNWCNIRFFPNYIMTSLKIFFLKKKIIQGRAQRGKWNLNSPTSEASEVNLLLTNERSEGRTNERSEGSV